MKMRLKRNLHVERCLIIVYRTSDATIQFHVILKLFQTTEVEKLHWRYHRTLRPNF